MESNQEADAAAIIEQQRAKRGYWFQEDVAPGHRIQLELKAIMCREQSPFQEVEVIDSYFGKTLVTDGKTQSAEFDEFAYHESLVHPTMLKVAMHPDSNGPAKTVFIGGGGELATAREVLKHKSIERCVMVDVDEIVVEVSKKFLPEWGGDQVLSDPRFELVIGDAYKWLTETEEMFDVIIMDISDPIEAGPGIMLYTQEFYTHAATRLNKGGVFVTQAGCADSIPAKHFDHTLQQDTSCFGPIRNTLKTTFDCVVPYSSMIPSFGTEWGFVMAFQTPKEMVPDVAEHETASPNPHGSIDRFLDNLLMKKERETEGENVDPLKYYDHLTHIRMFSLTKPLRAYLKSDKRIMTKDNPIFMF